MKMETVKHMKPAGREPVSVCVAPVPVVSMPSARVLTTDSNASALMISLVTPMSFAGEVSTIAPLVLYVNIYTHINVDLM